MALPLLVYTFDKMKNNMDEKRYENIFSRMAPHLSYFVLLFNV